MNSLLFLKYDIYCISPMRQAMQHMLEIRQKERCAYGLLLRKEVANMFDIPCENGLSDCGFAGEGGLCRKCKDDPERGKKDKKEQDKKK